MQPTIHRSYEALAFIGVTSAVLLLGCEAAAAPLAATRQDPLPNEVVLAWSSVAHSATTNQHDPMNVIQPELVVHAYAEPRAEPTATFAAASHDMAVVFFPAPMATTRAQVAAAAHATLSTHETARAGS